MSVFLFFLTIAVGLAVLELYIPGGILGAAAALSLAGAIVTGYVVFGRPTAHWVLAGTLAAAGVWVWWSLRVFPHSRLAGPIVARASIGRPDHGLDHLVGREGVALTPLRPAGTAEVEGEPIDVITEGLFVAPGRTVRVVSVSGNRVVVRAAAEQ